LVMESILETEAATILQFFAGLRGTVSVTFEEGTWSVWLYDLLNPHVDKLVVCNPRKNALLKDGNKSDRVDARKLAELLRGNQLKPVYHGETGVRMLRELSRSYLTIVKDLSRVMNRLKAVYLRTHLEPLIEERQALEILLKRGQDKSQSDAFRKRIKNLEGEIPRLTTEIEDEVWNLGIPLERMEMRKIAPGPTRAMDLEARFQVRLGFLLLKYLYSNDAMATAKLKFVNIARLVVLFYWSARLAEAQKGSYHLTCLRTREQLNVKSVEQCLTRAHLNRWWWSRGTLRPPKRSCDAQP
jgi:hypothetical protein